MNPNEAQYRSYQYLEKDTDYQDFELVSETSRVPSYTISLSESEEERVREVIGTSIVISLHDHPRVFPKDLSQLTLYNREGREFTGYEGLRVSGMDAVFDNLLDGSCFITSKMGWKWTDIIHDLGMKLCDIAHQDVVAHCTTVEGIVIAHDRGQIALIPSLESSTMIENEIDRIDVLYGLGIRMMGIVYSESNALGTGLKEERDGGLTYLGRRAVRRMNRLGMAIDVSHAGDITSLDVMEASSTPVFISHCGARALWNIKRLKPDEVLKACAAGGGVVGIEAAPHTTLTERHPQQSIESVMEHFEYCADLVGIDHVGFGPDTNFGDHVGLHRIFAQYLSIKEAFSKGKCQELDDPPYVMGMENPSENFTNIARWLVKHGYEDEAIRKVLGANILRVLRNVWFG